MENFSRVKANSSCPHWMATLLRKGRILSSHWWSADSLASIRSLARVLFLWDFPDWEGGAAREASGQWKDVDQRTAASAISFFSLLAKSKFRYLTEKFERKCSENKVAKQREESSEEILNLMKAKFNMALSLMHKLPFGNHESHNMMTNIGVCSGFWSCLPIFFFFFFFSFQPPFWRNERYLGWSTKFLPLSWCLLATC